MNNIELGRKLKEVRLSKKMTQSEVVGDFITRNMLSQIESGSATPSIKTLEYLSSVLDIDIQSLMSSGFPNKREGINNPEQVNVYDNKVLDIYLEAKTKYNFEQYKDAIDILEKNLLSDSILYDEMSLLISKCYLLLAQEYQSAKDPGKALECAKKAITYAGQGIYTNRQIKSEALLILDSLAEHIQI